MSTTTGRPVLAVASECAPLVKTGGLADVAGALPAALAPQGWAIRTLVPGYPSVMAALPDARVLADMPDLLGLPGRVLGARVGALDILILDVPSLYDRDGTPYLDVEGRDWPDNDVRFAALCLAAARIARDGIDGWRPELLHLHDWQAGLVPVYLEQLGVACPSVLTIHNIAFHGLTGADRMARLNLSPARFTVAGFEYFGKVSALKAGLVGASALNTVSPTYAQELTTDAYGMGLDGVIRMRAADMSGILNGIDTDTWDPTCDPAIKPFRRPAGKAANTRALRQEFDLADMDGPLAVVVSRLSDQKGLDLLLAALPAYLAEGGQLALLGSGDTALERDWRAMAAQYPEQVGVQIGYDEALSHRMYAGADAVLVPSRFEPCGLTQMYALRYGAIPVVARTGGLADTVIDANAAALTAGVATGILHQSHSVAALSHALQRLCMLHADTDTFRRVQKNAMKYPVGWDASAPLYAALYARLADEGKTNS
ncbi:Glycogen synthase 1 [Roseibaca ekhonensis]|uniref:Glycogen synthase n=1 Tax=Roseinatronobacter ekhonensis TaxID=254356 RepID=A0A3B0MAS5_9RHOB|nr:glycogen synthase GlgA [Roseibaca ekhonensis]SUZ32962.1 Glycogen synthase 1 [Roseibaca ekhonensis]